MSIIITILQIALGMTIIVGIHELGHMLLAKLFGMRVDSFTIGFPPKIFKKKIGETEYGIGSVPLGGYVSIAGMIDESNAFDDNAEEKNPKAPEPYEFRAKPAWQRLIVILGGIIMNILLGIFIYTFLIFFSGTTYISKDEVNKYGITTTDIGEKLGFKEGDKILTINGKNFEDFQEIFNPTKFLETNKATILEVENQGEKRLITLDKENFYNFVISRDETMVEKYMCCIAPRIPFEIKNVTNEKLPIVANDKIIAINENNIEFLHELKNALWDNRGKSVVLKFLHDGKEKSVVMDIATDGRLGIEINSLLQPSVKKFSFLRSIELGTKKAYNVLKMNALGLWRIITGKISAKENLSGPIGIIKVFTQSNDWIFFWNIVAVLSLCLGLMNVLPIPALDGGHAFLILVEIVIGRKIKEKYLIKIQQLGLALMLLLFLYCAYNDVIHLF